MGGWLEYIRTFWPIGVAVSGLIAGILVLWLRSGFATRDSINKVHGRIDGLTESRSSHEERLKHLELSFDSAPTRHDLQEDISDLRVDVAGLIATTEGIKSSTAQTNSMIKMIFDKGMPSR